MNGIYVPPVRALRRAIVDLLADPERAARLGARARQMIESRMSLDIWADRIAEVIRDTARRRLR